MQSNRNCLILFLIRIRNSCAADLVNVTTRISLTVKGLVECV